MKRLPILCAVAAVAAGVLSAWRDWPLVGHDYRYFVPRLLDTDLHLRLNGVTVQWYTPSFGGGLPAFPNPQHLQYSLPQALTFLVDPWQAIILSAVIYMGIGAYAMHRVLSRTLGFGALASALGVLFWLGNGFLFERMIVGHVGFQVFPLGAVLLDALIDRRRAVAGNGSIVALVAAVMLYQAGFFTLVLLALSLLLTLLLIELLRRGQVKPARLAGVLAIGAPLAALMCAPRIYATFALMSHFPRVAADVFAIGPLQALVGLAAQLIGPMTAMPVVLLARLDPTAISTALLKLTGASVRVGIWEVDTGLSPVLWVFLAAGAVGAARTVARHGIPAMDRHTKLMVAALVVTTWIAVEMTLARGLFYPLLRHLPILSSLHVNHRYAAAFIMPLVIVGAVVIDRWTASAGRRLQIAALTLALAAPFAYLAFPAAVHLRTFDMTQSRDDWSRIQSGERFPIARIERVEDDDALSRQASSALPYEPLFGYALETFHPQFQVGDVHQAAGGAFNMTNPASLVFPELNGLQPFDRIAIADAPSLDAFIERRQPAWQVPAAFSILNVLALVALVASVMVVLVSAARRNRQP
jgi:hypothetical protein